MSLSDRVSVSQQGTGVRKKKFTKSHNYAFISFQFANCLESLTVFPLMNVIRPLLNKYRVLSTENQNNHILTVRA